MWSRPQLAVEEVVPTSVQPFVYRAVLEAMGEGGEQGDGNGNPTASNPNAASQVGRDSRPSQKTTVSEDEARAREAQARSVGIRDGEAQARSRYERELAAERQAVSKSVEDFARDRENYFSHVEAEVVKLAIGIARKILHREVQVDPLLLAGVVRVALDKIAAGTSVRLRVHPDHVYAWHDFFSNQQEHRVVPELLGDATLGMGQCVLETALGTTELTLEAQLAEIERGFFDLLAQRPVTT
jgi:flagellar assembly protein FliH